MTSEFQPNKRVTISWRQAVGLVVPYIKNRIMEQVRSVWLIVLYLLLFQILVLGIPIVDGALITFGMAMVVVGLAFFMEGLLLGLMPLGELIGLKLPQRVGLVVILVFAFILGFGVTLAEPAIGALKILGSSVRAWDAPLLFVLLNRYAHYLVFAVGIGVGCAVVFGMLRFLYNWSLKPFLYILVPILTILSIAASFNPNLLYLTGLAWDCGAVTTGPVTVPLVLALGIGITRIVGGADAGVSGFGVVTLASLFPILTVLALGMALLPQVPSPMTEEAFLSIEHRDEAVKVLGDADALVRYAFVHAREEGVTAYFGDVHARRAFVAEMATDGSARSHIFGEDEKKFMDWVARHGSGEEKMALFGSVKAAREYLVSSSLSVEWAATSLFVRNFRSAAQAIIPLTIFMLLVLFLLLRERLPRTDEMMFGIVAAFIGMGLFNIGMETGLSKIGDQVGSKLPSSFTSLPIEEERETIKNFSPDVVTEAVSPSGGRERFFFRRAADGSLETIPYQEENYDEITATYIHVPRVGPLFGGERSVFGIIVVLLFAFFMGYGATLAEPALNALGIKVEELTVGTFKKSFLMQAVAGGVGIGIAFGVAKIIWDIPLIWLLAPPYLLLLFVSKVSSEEYVNIGWDSAGVTTGPVTVPLVLAMGLGIGVQVGVVEGFGILAMASVYPILSVLLTGLYAARRRTTPAEEQVTKSACTDSGEQEVT